MTNTATMTVDQAEMDKIVQLIVDHEKMVKASAAGGAAAVAAVPAIDFFMDEATNEILLVVAGAGLAAPIIVPFAGPVLALLGETLLNLFKDTLETAREKMEDMDLSDDEPSSKGSLEDAIARIRARSKANN